jgi:hypothetical protein
MVKGVRSKVDPDRKKDDDIEEAKIDLLPAHKTQLKKHRLTSGDCCPS